MDRPRETGTPSDEELMERYIDGGDDGIAAFETLFERHRARLFRFVFYSLGSRPAAEDAFQDVFLRMIKGRHTYRRAGSFQSWLFRVARNALIDRHRRLRVRPDAGSGIELDERVHLGAAEETSSSFFIQEALRTMPEAQREVFLLREEGLPFREIAQLVGAGVNTVKSRMRYALDHLRHQLDTERASGTRVRS